VAPPPPPPPPAETPWYHRSVTRWSLAGASLALAGAGIAMMALDGQCASSEKPTCKNLYDTNTLGWGLVGGAALVGGTAVYLFWTSAPDGGKVVAFGWGGHF
jgi:hypothetical protein